MGSIYGWLSPTETTDSTSLIKKQYAASKCLGAAPVITSSLFKTAGVGGHGLNNAPSIYQSDKLLAIMEGSPRWQDRQLENIAQTYSTAHALAEGFLLYGKTVLEKIRGPFAFCLLEPERQYALLAIDRLGLCSLAFYFHNNLLVFGSQIGQILANPEVVTSIDTQGIFNYLYFHVIPSPGSIYKDISKLQPGEFFEISNGQLYRNFYWQLCYNESTLSKKELLEQLKDQLEQSTIDCAPDHQTGTFLSGGLDSSTVTGMYQKVANRAIDAFTMGFEAEGYDEMEYARASAKHFKINLHEYYVTPADVLKAIPLIAENYDEPFGNASAIPTYYCAKFARDHGIKGLLAGDGGDEIFAGNTRYAKQKIFDLYRYIPHSLRTVLEPIAFNLPPLRKVKSYIEQAKIAMPERMESYNFLHRTPLTDIFQQDFLELIEPDQPLQNLISTYHRSTSEDLIKKMLSLDGKFTLADNDLRKVNRMCELAGVGVQYPMLNENLVEFAASIPSKWLMQGFELRSFYREAMKGFLPTETLKKSKQGFGLPFGIWMNNDKELKNFAETSLRGIEKRNFLNPTYIKNLIQLQKEGHASYYGVMIWILVILEQWLNAHEH
jgi:asparagine synthase (glutamine-hydrolysing)